MKQSHLPPPPRVAYTLAEFASLFGKNRSWAYRLAAKGQIKTIHGYGATLIPATELGRLIGDQEGSEAGGR